MLTYRADNPGKLSIINFTMTHIALNIYAPLFNTSLSCLDLFNVSSFLKIKLTSPWYRNALFNIETCDIILRKCCLLMHWLTKSYPKAWINGYWQIIS